MAGNGIGPGTGIGGGAPGVGTYIPPPGPTDILFGPEYQSYFFFSFSFFFALLGGEPLDLSCGEPSSF